jgi:hypothetical protein
MNHESEEDGTPRKEEEQRKQPYEKPTVAKRLITRAEKDRLIGEQFEKKTSRVKGRPAGKDSRHVRKVDAVRSAGTSIQTVGTLNSSGISDN